jgi:hypothetical protein
MRERSDVLSANYSLRLGDPHHATYNFSDCSRHARSSAESRCERHGGAVARTVLDEEAILRPDAGGAAAADDYRVRFTYCREKVNLARSFHQAFSSRFEAAARRGAQRPPWPRLADLRQMEQSQGGVLVTPKNGIERWIDFKLHIGCGDAKSYRLLFARIDIRRSIRVPERRRSVGTPVNPDRDGHDIGHVHESEAWPLVDRCPLPRGAECSSTRH